MVTFGSGTAPAGMYYVSRRGIPVSRSLGIFTINYTIQRITICLYFLFSFLSNYGAMNQYFGEYKNYMAAGVVLAVLASCRPDHSLRLCPAAPYNIPTCRKVHPQRKTKRRPVQMAGKSSHRAYRGPQSPKKQETIIKSVYPEFPKTKRMVSHPRHHLPPAQFPRTLAIHGHSRNDDRPVRRHPRPRRRRSRRIPLRPLLPPL